MFFTTINHKKTTNFFLKNVNYTHKLLYSKVSLQDASAAVLGVTLGAFSAYLTLVVVGSCGIDLSDLTTVFYFSSLLLILLLKSVHLSRSPLDVLRASIFTTISTTISVPLSTISTISVNIKTLLCLKYRTHCTRLVNIIFYAFIKVKVKTLQILRVVRGEP